MQYAVVLSCLIFHNSAISHISHLPSLINHYCCCEPHIFISLMSYKDCEMNNELTDADVAPFSDANTNHHEGSNYSFPVMWMSHTTASMLSATSNHIDDSRSILATSIDDVRDNEAKFSVSFKVCPKIPCLKSTKKSLWWEIYLSPCMMEAHVEKFPHVWLLASVVFGYSCHFCSIRMCF